MENGPIGVRVHDSDRVLVNKSRFKFIFQMWEEIDTDYLASKRVMMWQSGGQVFIQIYHSLSVQGDSGKLSESTGSGIYPTCKLRKLIN